MTMHMPGAAPERQGSVTVKQARKRAGLLPMLVDSQHQITVQGSDGEPVQIYVRARQREDFPRAKAVFVCLHAGCAGKTWDTFEAMQDAHPQRSVMEKRGEIHVYGLWSNDAAAPAAKVKAAEEALAQAKAARDKAQKMVDKLTESDKPESLALLPAAEKRRDETLSKALAAEAELGRVKGCIGLLAPSERGSAEE